MTIAIHQRLKPFSHEKKQRVLIPGSSTLLTLFPCKIIGEDFLNKSTHFVLDLKISDFYKEFTTEVDFDKNQARVFGECKEGFIELKIFKENKALYIQLERFKQESLTVFLNGQEHILKLKHPLKLVEEAFESKSVNEKIYLGISKKQDVSRINKESSMKEFLPFLFCLGSKLELPLPIPQSGVLNLVDELKIGSQPQRALILEKILKGFYSDFFIPSLQDDFHQGLQNLNDTRHSALYLNLKMAVWIKSFLAAHKNSDLFILHDLPRELIAGKACALSFSFGKVHLEWTKGFIRQMVLDIQVPCDLNIQFTREVKKFRVRKKGKKIPLATSFEPGIYHFDQFQA